MDVEISGVLFALLRSAIYGSRLTEEERNNYYPQLLQDLLKISSKHDLVHLLILGLKQNKLITKENAELQNYIFNAAYRCERLQCEYKELCDILEKAKIAFLPLKGSIIRQFYPEAWMRTSCDIDILVHEEDTGKVKEILVKEYSYTYQGKGSHDLSFYSPRGIHVEIHYTLIAEGEASKVSTVLKSVWDKVFTYTGFVYRYEMPDDLFYFYHIAHMAKHFEHGGCGIRPFIDLWILDHIDSADKEKRDRLLNDGELLKFANVARKLSRVWFENEEHDCISQQMEDYVLRGGVYGSRENSILVQQQKKGGKIKYALSKIFIPYDTIKFHYPILQKHRWLTPFMEVRRWFKLIFCGHAKRTLNELKYNQTITAEKADVTKNFLESIGL